MSEEILRMPVNPHFMKKIRTFFRAKNHAVKGTMTKKDFENLADRYTEIASRNTLREKQMRRKVLKIWEDYFEEASKIMPLTEEVFAKCVRAQGSAKVKITASHYGDVFFDLIDLNADGIISPAEFKLFFRVYKLDENLSEATFKVLDKGNKGHITYDEFIDAMINFFNPDIDKPAPEDILYGPLVEN